MNQFLSTMLIASEITIWLFHAKITQNMSNEKKANLKIFRIQLFFFLQNEQLKKNKQLRSEIVCNSKLFERGLQYTNQIIGFIHQEFEF